MENPAPAIATDRPLRPTAGRPRSVATRRLRERVIVGSLAVAATFSILITTGIVLILAR